VEATSVCRGSPGGRGATGDRAGDNRCDLWGWRDRSTERARSGLTVRRTMRTREVDSESDDALRTRRVVVFGDVVAGHS